jgi:hypothetical protein
MPCFSVLVFGTQYTRKQLINNIGVAPISIKMQFKKKYAYV